ncbi:MAG: hypothetical protein DYG98_13050 [Haliscomenobacteraceae bacterium CHB4]|nr:hypothetical protein [Saprospiraceae bacterium]MCE7923978.1 hypothetical protein [Haliscomenobacteraceae bacterium CHB4]
MKKSVLLLTALFMGILAFNACKKSDDAKANDAEIMTAEDLSANEDFSEQTDIDVDVAIEERGGPSACPTVTLAQPWGTWPNTITIDYGTACTRPDGRVLSGKIIVNQTNEIRQAGAVRTITHEDFYVDDVKVEGTRTWTNNGTDANGDWSYTKTATGMKLTFPDGTSTTWNKTRTSTLIDGASTPTHWDDVWSSTGSASGVNRNGDTYSAVIIEPLIKKAICRWISEGVIEFTRNGNTSTLDFGDGSCDRFGTLTTPNGDTFSIRLRR